VSQELYLQSHELVGRY